MNIGIVLPEVGGYSSVALEFKKWHDIMTSLGHRIYIMTGKSRAVLKNMTVMTELYCENDYNITFSSRLFDVTDDDIDELTTLKHTSKRIGAMISSWMNDISLDILIIENYFSIPSNLPVTMALKAIIPEHSCKKIIKHHDAFYKNNAKKITKSQFIQQVLKDCFPLDLPDICHVVSNRMIKSYLSEICRIKALIIPYVMATKPIYYWDKETSLLLSETFKVSTSDHALVHFTDLLPSSKFERVFDLLSSINDDGFKVITIARCHKDFSDYFDYLMKKIDDLKLSSRLILLREDDLIRNKTVSIDDIFLFSKGTICLDAGRGFGQPIHMAIQNKCGLLFCTESQLDWLELSDLGCHIIQISRDLTTEDIHQINHHLNQPQGAWVDQNFKLMKQYYSTSFLKYTINNLLMRL